MGEGRFKLFVENFLIYGLGGMLNKIIPFVMLPLVTRLMPNSFYFGLSDISSVIISFGQALAIMGMYDAMFRMFFEKEDNEYKKNVCSTAFSFTLIMSIVIFTLMILFRNSLAEAFFGDSKYAYLLCLTASSVLVGSTNTIVSAPTRMENRRKIFLITNLLSPIISYSISIPLLLKGYYTVALPLASLLSAFLTEIIFGVLYYKWFTFKIDKQLLKDMLKIALPLFPNFLVYWIFNSCDRLMISNLIGAEWNGVYAVGAKIGQASQLIYSAFAGGWQFFAFSTMKDDDQVEMTSNVFEYLGIITFSSGMMVAAISRPLFTLLFSEEYLAGHIVMPYLFVAPLLLMLYQVVVNQFLVVKKTWPSIGILAMGALINIIINYFGIRKIGIEGAALGTLLGYAVAIVGVTIVLTYMKLVRISKRFGICILMFVLYSICWRFFTLNMPVISLLLGGVVIGVYIFLYRNDLCKLISQEQTK